MGKKKTNRKYEPVDVSKFEQLPHERAKDIDISDDLNNSSAPQTPLKRSKDIGISENLNNSSESQTTPLKSRRRCEPGHVSKFDEQLPRERHSGEVGKSTPEHSNYNRKNDHGKSYDKKQKGNKNSFKEDKIQNKGHSKSHEDEKEWSEKKPINMKKTQDEDKGEFNDSLIERTKDIDISDDLNNSSAPQTPHKRSKDEDITENLNNSSASQFPLKRHSGEVGKSTPEHSNYNRINDHGKSYDKKQKGNKNSFKEDKIQNKGHSKSHEDEKECDFLKEIDQDLFKLPKEYSLAHCVAEDLRMGAGIAVEFKRIFGGVGKLFDQKLKVGDVGIVNRHEQNAFYLITKSNSSGKPTIRTVEKTLQKLLEEMKKRELTKLGIPTIGCGLDALDWAEVKSLIIKIFAGSSIHISVCIPRKFIDRQAPWSTLKVYFSPKNLWEMEQQTDRIILIDIDKIHKNNWIDAIVEKVNDTYQFKEKLLNDIKMKKLNPGDITLYNVKNEILICAFIKQSEHYYTSLEKVFENIKCYIKTSYRYLAIQSGSIQCDDTFNHIERIVLISRSIIHKSELWLCGAKDQTHKQLYNDYCKNRRQSYSRNYSNSMNRTSYVYNNSSSFDSKEEDGKNWRPQNDSCYGSKN